MAKVPQEANSSVYELFSNVKKKHHALRLEDAKIVVFFNEDKPFKKNRFNWGKVKRCAPETRALVDSTKMAHDFFITISQEAWNLLDVCQREGYVDLLLTRCSFEYEPEMSGGDDKKKPKKVVDDHGRVKYTDKPKYDDDGLPKWVVEPLDMQTITDNVSRYGDWFPDFKDFSDALKDAKNSASYGKSVLPAA